MSKSFNVSFQQSFKMVLSDEVIKLVRTQLSQIVKEGEEAPEKLTSKDRAFVRTLKDQLLKEDDEFLPWFLRFAMRTQFRDDVNKILNKDRAMTASNFSPMKVEITPRG